jgi:hypothetical protein
MLGAGFRATKIFQPDDGICAGFLYFPVAVRAGISEKKSSGPFLVPFAAGQSACSQVPSRARSIEASQSQRSS